MISGNLEKNMDNYNRNPIIRVQKTVDWRNFRNLLEHEWSEFQDLVEWGGMDVFKWDSEEMADSMLRIKLKFDDLYTNFEAYLEIEKKIEDNTPRNEEDIPEVEHSGD